MIIVSHNITKTNKNNNTNLIYINTDMEKVYVFMKHIVKGYGSWYCAYLALPKHLSDAYEDEWDSLNIPADLDEITYIGKVSDFVNEAIINIDCDGMFDHLNYMVVGFDYHHFWHEEHYICDDFEWCKNRTLEMYNSIKEYMNVPRMPIPHFYKVQIEYVNHDGCIPYDEMFFEDRNAAVKYMRKMFDKDLEYVDIDGTPNYDHEQDGYIVLEDENSSYHGFVSNHWFKDKEIEYRFEKINGGE